MNIVLFEPGEIEALLPLSDARVRHVLDVLRLAPGDSFDAGLIDGPRGKATVVALDGDGLRVSFTGMEMPPPLEPVTLIVGMPRPQTARKVLEEATSLGVQALHFVATQRGEPSYGQSRLWSSGEWRRHLVAGASQAFSTRLPAVTWGKGLPEVIAGGASEGTRLALDNYEAPEAMSGVAVAAPVTITIGPERGWSEAERSLLREAGFRFVHLGERVLRVETACVAAIVLAHARLGSL